MGYFPVEVFKASSLRLEVFQWAVLEGEQSHGLRNCASQGVKLKVLHCAVVAD